MLTTPPSASRTGVGVPGRRSAGVASSVAGGAATISRCHAACSVTWPFVVSRMGSDLARPEPSVHASNTLEVVPHGAGDAHPAVGVLHPLNRHLVQPHVHVAREEQQLGVEEPAIVFDEGEERLRRIGAQRLEPALRVVKGGRNAARSTAMYPRLSTSRLGDRLTRESGRGATRSRCRRRPR